DLSRQFGVPIVLLVPPTLRQDHSGEIQELGNQVGVPIWVLSTAAEFPRELFRDGFHLNRRGATMYTTRLSQQIRSLSAKPSGCAADNPMTCMLVSPDAGTQTGH